MFFLIIGPRSRRGNCASARGLQGHAAFGSLAGSNNKRPAPQSAHGRTSMKIKVWKVLASAMLALAVSAVSVAAQQKPIELKLAYFVGDQHAMSKWLIKWAEQ